MKKLIENISIKHIFAGIVLGLSITMFLEYMIYLIFQNFWYHPKMYFGYHIHHSVYGLLIMAVGMFLYTKPRAFYLFMGLGLGIIVAHTLNDGRLVFIE